MRKKISMNLKFPFSALISAFLLVGELYVLLHVDLWGKLKLICFAAATIPKPIHFKGEFNPFCCDYYGKVTLLNSRSCIMKHECADLPCL